MSFVNVGKLGTAPGRRDELVAVLTRRSDLLGTLGCRLYEVGVSEQDPDAVFVMELWDSAEAHRGSLEHPEVRASIAEARPVLSGANDGLRFEVVGSPLRD